MTDAAPFALRPMTAADEPFIYNSLLKSYRESPAVRAVPNTIYFQEHHKVIERIFTDVNCNCLVAVNPEDANQIYGYGLSTRSGGFVALHFVYVKHPFRSHGIGKALEVALTKDATKVFYTHYVKYIKRIVADRNYVFHPYLLGA